MFDGKELIALEIVMSLILLLCVFATLEEIQGTLFYIIPIIVLDTIIRIIRVSNSKNWTKGHKLEL